MTLLPQPSIQELEKLTQIACALCKTPTSAINLVYDEEVISITGTGDFPGRVAREDSFCHYTVREKDKVLVVEDPKEDVRFEKNKYVTDAPYLGFYAGAPIITSSGEVLGTLCVQDKKPNQLNSSQKQALLNLASMAQHHIDQQRKLARQGQKISKADERLKLVSDHAPGVLFQFSLSDDREYDVAFISKGIESLIPWLNPEDLYKNPDILFEVIHPEDRPQVEEQIGYAYQNKVPWNTEYRVINPEGGIIWFSSKARPQISESGKVTWYGTLQDVTVKREYIANLEKLIADISHVLRRPITTMQGLINVLTNDQLKPEESQQILQMIDTTFKEFDDFTRDLSQTFDEQKKTFIKRLG